MAADKPRVPIRYGHLGAVAARRAAGIDKNTRGRRGLAHRPDRGAAPEGRLTNLGERSTKYHRADRSIVDPDRARHDKTPAAGAASPIGRGRGHGMAWAAGTAGAPNHIARAPWVRYGSANFR